MEEFVCKVCSKSHPIYYGMDAATIPNLELLVNGNKERLKKFNDNMYLLDNETAITKGVIEVNTVFNKSLKFYVWVSFPAKEFAKKTKDFSNQIGLDIAGEVLTEIFPFYENTKGLKIEAIFQAKNMTDTIAKINVCEKSQLKFDKKNGLTKKRLLEIMEKIHHSNKS